MPNTWQPLYIVPPHSRHEKKLHDAHQELTHKVNEHSARFSAHQSRAGAVSWADMPNLPAIRAQMLTDQVELLQAEHAIVKEALVYAEAFMQAERSRKDRLQAGYEKFSAKLTKDLIAIGFTAPEKARDNQEFYQAQTAIHQVFNLHPETRLFRRDLDDHDTHASALELQRSAMQRLADITRELRNLAEKELA